MQFKTFEQFIFNLSLQNVIITKSKAPMKFALNHQTQKLRWNYTSNYTFKFCIHILQKYVSVA